MSLQVVQNIYNDGGLGAFWTGLAPSLILTANPAITFTAFDNLKQRVAPLLSRTAQSLTILQSFVLAMVSKTLALILTYPLIRAKVVMLGRLRQLALENSGGSKPKQHKRSCPVFPGPATPQPQILYPMAPTPAPLCRPPP